MLRLNAHIKLLLLTNMEHIGHVVRMAVSGYRD